MCILKIKQIYYSTFFPFEVLKPENAFLRVYMLGSCFFLFVFFSLFGIGFGLFVKTD